MKMQLDYLSLRLEKLRRDVEAARDRDGGVHLSMIRVSDVLVRLSDLVGLSLNIEQALSRSERNCLAYREQLVASNARALEILNLMRPAAAGPCASNIIPFRPRSAPHRSGGDAA